MLYPHIVERGHSGISSKKGTNPIMKAFLKAPVVKNPPRDVGSIPGSEISPGEGNGNPVFLPGKTHGQRSLGAIVHKVTKSHT